MRMTFLKLTNRLVSQGGGEVGPAAEWLHLLHSPGRSSARGQLASDSGCVRLHRHREHGHQRAPAGYLCLRPLKSRSVNRLGPLQGESTEHRWLFRAILCYA